MRRVLAGLLVSSVFTVLATSSVGFADEPGPNIVPVQVTRIKTARSDEQADALTEVLRSEFAKLPGWSVSEGNYSFEVLSVELVCPTPPNTTCFQSMADKMHTDQFVWGSVEKVGDKAVGELHLWLRGQEEGNKVQLSYDANLTDPANAALQSVVNKALMDLTGGRPMGSVDIAAGEVDGEVFVDGVLAGKISKGVATIPAPYGEHVLEVRAPGYANVSGTIFVELNDRVPLILEPVAIETGRSTSTSTPVKKIVGISAIGAGAGLALGGLAFSLNIHGMNNNKAFKKFRDENAPNSDVCDVIDKHSNSSEGYKQAHDFCDKAPTYQILQYVFYGLGVASAGVGTYLLLTDNPSEKSTTTTGNRLLITPTAYTGGTGVDVRYTF